jgi:trk system potassium uptake protein TrkA
MARVLIVGAGKLGFHLAALLDRSGHRVSALDRDLGACSRVAGELDLLAVQGDGTELDCLGEAGARQVDYVVAATGRDEDNLAICRIAKERYGVGRVVCRVINPRNEALYRLAGADATIDPTSMAAARIRDALPADGMRLISLFESSDYVLAELEISEDSPAAGRAVAELGLPADCALLALVRAGKTHIVRGPTFLEAGDRVYALASPEAMALLREGLQGRSP